MQLHWGATACAIVQTVSAGGGRIAHGFLLALRALPKRDDVSSLSAAVAAAIGQDTLDDTAQTDSHRLSRAVLAS